MYDQKNDAQKKDEKNTSTPSTQEKQQQAGEKITPKQTPTKSK